MSARNKFSSLKHSPHTNWTELSAQERFPLLLIHMRILFPVTSQQITLCQLWSFTPSWDGWKSHGGRCELAAGAQTSGKDTALRTPAGAGQDRQQEQSSPGNKGNEKQVTTMRFVSQRTAEPLRSYSRWAQASTGYRKHSALCTCLVLI